MLGLLSRKLALCKEENMNFKKLIGLALILAVILPVAACGGGGEEAPTEESPAEESPAE